MAEKVLVKGSRLDRGEASRRGARSLGPPGWAVSGCPRSHGAPVSRPGRWSAGRGRDPVTLI